MKGTYHFSKVFWIVLAYVLASGMSGVARPGANRGARTRRAMALPVRLMPTGSLTTPRAEGFRRNRPACYREGLAVRSVAPARTRGVGLNRTGPMGGMRLLVVVPSYPSASHAFAGVFNERCVLSLVELCESVEVIAPRPWVPPLLGRFSVSLEELRRIPNARGKERGPRTPAPLRSGPQTRSSLLGGSRRLCLLQTDRETPA